MLIPNVRQRGVTLIELMVGIALLAILLGLAAPSFSLWIQNSRIRGAAESIQNGLSKARTEAVQRNAEIQLTLTSLAASGTAADWAISCVTPVDDGDDDDDLADCPGSNTDPETIEKYTAAEGASSIVANAGGTSTITFNGMGRATPSITVDVSNPAGGTCIADGGQVRCLRVTVSTSGQVRTCDPGITDTNDPRKC